jgi:cell division inhibitor SepF
VALTDSFRKVLEYLGLNDGEDDYEDDLDERDRDRDRERERPRAASPEDELERAYRERPNVRKIGPRRRSDDFEDIFAEDAPMGAGARATAVRPVESARRASQVEVFLVVPKSFNDAQQIADKFKTTVPVILNLQSAETDLAKRLIDFSSGLTYALDGGMQRVADKVFLLTPRNVEVSAEERARLLEKGFFNQY